MNKRQFVDSKKAFILATLFGAATIIFFWLFGLRTHKSVIENATISTSILSVAFFVFLFVNLYRGAKLKENLGKITDKFDSKKLGGLKDVSPTDGEGIPDVGEGIGGIIVSILLWIVVAFVFSYLLWAFAAVLWLSVLFLFAILYWIFFRATRRVFRHSKKCEGQIDYSFIYALFYTVMYSSWIYAIIYFSEAFS